MLMLQLVDYVHKHKQ